jgi:predicted dithiol-disulfide oxidoreductase (DUF899 family)
MWHTGLPAADQCEGCTFNTGHVLELSYLHSREVTFAVFCQGPYDESARYRDFMGWGYGIRGGATGTAAGSGTGRAPCGPRGVVRRCVARCR